MAALNFPNTPSVGDTHSENGGLWRWDGVSWNAYGLLSATPDNQAASGDDITALTYGESLTPGAAVYVKSDGSVWKADRNGTATYPCMGLALETASSGSHLVLLRGFYRDDSLFAWTVGGTLYLSDTAGLLTQSDPAAYAANDVVQVLGIATHADRIYFNPQLDLEVHL